MRIRESVLPSLPKRPQVIPANDDMALGAIEALQSQGVKPGEILVTGFDAVPEALARVRDGWLAVTADQRPGFGGADGDEPTGGQRAREESHHRGRLPADADHQRESAAG